MIIYEENAGFASVVQNGSKNSHSMLGCSINKKRTITLHGYTMGSSHMLIPFSAIASLIYFTDPGKKGCSLIST